MRTFDSLDADFRRAFKQAAKQGIVKFTIEGIKDDPESIYPMFEVSNNHVTYYSVQRQGVSGFSWLVSFLLSV